MAKYKLPLDPECPEVVEFHETLYGDPMTKAMGAPTDDFERDFAIKHRPGCKRCGEYGVANIEVVD